MQKVYLARYARVNPFEWEGREVAELQEYFEALAEILKKEGALGTATEER